MNAAATLYCTAPDAGTAERIARAVVDERLAACVNILGTCRSIYRWDGAVGEADEVPMLFKTGAALAEPLARRIAELHPYDLPAVETWPIQAPQAVARWFEEATSRTPKA